MLAFRSEERAGLGPVSGTELPAKALEFPGRGERGGVFVMLMRGVGTAPQAGGGVPAEANV